MIPVEIAVLHEIDDAVVEAFRRLLPQLSASATAVTAVELAAVIGAPGTAVLIAREPATRRIVGALTLVTFRIPTGLRAWIEDVVVDEAMRGRGLGEALTRQALEQAKALGAHAVELTSRPSREAANRLYQRIGFVPRHTNLYRIVL